jgi:hypothetical protein
MKTTLGLQSDSDRQIKLRFFVQGCTLKNLVNNFLRRGLGLEFKKYVHARRLAICVSQLRRSNCT